MAELFISYSQQDRARVKRLVDALTGEGYEVWWDLEIRAGDSFDQLIEDTLKRVRCVVAVWSRQSVKSEWLRAESAWAKDRNRLVSIRIDENLELPLKFYHVHAKSMVGWEGGREAPAFQELVADIRKIAGPAPLPAPARASGMESPTPRPEVAQEQERAPASIQAPASPADRGRQPAAPDSPPETRSHGLVIGMISLAIAGLIGGVILFNVQDKPDPGDEPGGPEPTQDQVEPTTPPVSAEIPNDGVMEPEMVVIHLGEFQMGCVSGEGCYDGELPVRTVTFDKPFAMGKYEVTFAEYDRFCEATGRGKPDDEDWGRGRRPAINVSWDDARAYAAWLSEQTGLRFRLPSEAEWEYATRGGTATPFSTGECIDTDQANYDGNYGWKDCPETGVSRGKTVEVGALPANPEGLHDVHGNVWEWVADCWRDSYEGAPTDGSTWGEEGGGGCGRRVLRGGSWGLFPEGLRSAYRSGGDAGYRGYYIGFRLAQDR